MRAPESVAFGPFSGSSPVFNLGGGQYMALACCPSGWNGGSAVLNILGPDNATWLTTIVPLLADGGGILDLPPGQYQWALSGVSGVFLSVTRVPVAE